MALERLTRSDPLQLGRFTILARIGGGGMGVVYLAEDDQGAAAAVKVVKSELAMEDSFRARFRREVEAGRRVSGRCTAKFLDADTFAPSPWLATEYVPGPTLHHEVYAHGPLVGPRLVGLAAGLADALHSIHSVGLVHRDLKPANIILAPEAPKVIDFGVTMATDSTILTTTGTLVGSPAYMSPEQARGTSSDVGPAADVFSWASTVVFAATGSPPFGEGEAAAVLYRVVHDEPELAGIEPVLLPFVAAALNKDPAQRPSPTELLSGLAVVAEGSPAAAIATPGTGFAPPPAPSAEGVLAATWRPPYAAAPPAETVLVEARELRANVPRREAETRRQERRRANRAIFFSSLVALGALLVVALVIIRSSGGNEVALSQTKERDLTPDSTATPTDSVVTTLPSAPTSTAPAAAGGGAGATTPTTAPRAGAQPPASTTPTTASTPTSTPAPPPSTPPPTGFGPPCTMTITPADRQWNTLYTVTITFQRPTPVTVQAVRRGGTWGGSVAWSFPAETTTSKNYILRYQKATGSAPPPAATIDDFEPENLIVDISARLGSGAMACGTGFTTPAQPPR